MRANAVATSSVPIVPGALDTGDLILFDANDGTWSTTAIEYSGRCGYSHVALIVRTMDGTDRLAIWEATNGPGEGQIDLITEKPVAGVRLVELTNRLRLEPRYAVIRLEIEDPRARTALRNRVWQFALDNAGKDYEGEFWHLVYSWYDGPSTLLRTAFGCCLAYEGDSPIAPVAGLNPSSPDRYFCSELVAETLMAVGVLRARPLPPNPLGLLLEPSSEYTPGDFYHTRTFNKRLTPGYRYGLPTVPKAITSLLLSS